MLELHGPKEIILSGRVDTTALAGIIILSQYVTHILDQEFPLLGRLPTLTLLHRK